MLLGDTKIGKPIDIYINRDGVNYRVASKIEDARDGRVCITLIASAKRIFQFLDTDVIDIVYRTNDRMWKWSNVKGGITELDGEKFHCLYSDKPGESYNRRNAFRVSISDMVNLSYKINLEGDFDEAEECYRTEHCPAMLRDISELGVGFYTNEVLSAGTEISFEFPTDVGEIKCYAVVIRFFESRQSRFKYYYGARFIETNRTLTKYIYDRQRQELAKARGARF
ncbi:MAG: PilZ domain-containing protein [Clostridiales bacterium]|nr:PilZ domain-containing protein [Clostridiales bacterium]